MLRPQPIDLLPWPAGGLLFPEGESNDAVRAALVAGRTPEDPPAWWAAAARDDVDGAYAALEAVDGPVAAYNRFVLKPDGAALEALRLSGAPEPLATMVEVAAYKCGLRDDLPAMEGLDGELLASALLASASASMEAGDLTAAEGHVRSAIDAAAEASPGLASQLALSLVETIRQRGGAANEQLEPLESASARLEGTTFSTLRGELALERAVVLQESAGHDHRRMQSAAGLFQEAITLLDAEAHPRSHGFAQMRLGLCYMALPMQGAGDALRMGVATQALQAAIEVLNPEREPDLWCAAATNLANAYQMLPSQHLAENLEKGLGLYDQAIEIRAKSDDPDGVARLLFNKAQAAASLEKYDVAIEALERACPILQDLRRSADLNNARHLLEDLKRQTTVRGDA